MHNITAYLLGSGFVEHTAGEHVGFSWIWFRPCGQPPAEAQRQILPAKSGVQQASVAAQRSSTH